ncbi:MAG: aldehyde dehydrogenase family protein, partial [Sphingomonadaceae bacterium]|nr:aldehyde dehydrogenase family protein [Sphingomonadaceae bacterium]
MQITRPALSPAAQAFVDRKDFGLCIDGEWKPASGGATFPTVDPATGETTAEIARGQAADVDRAVAAARRALPGWSAILPMARSQLLWKIADLIEANIDELAELETLDQGKPLFVGRWAEIPGAVAQFRFFGGQAQLIEGTTIPTSIGYAPEGKSIHAYTVREP